MSLAKLYRGGATRTSLDFIDHTFTAHNTGSMQVTLFFYHRTDWKETQFRVDIQSDVIVKSIPASVLLAEVGRRIDKEE